MNKKLLWKIVKNILKVVISIAALYWVFSKVSIDDLKDAVVNSNPIFLLLAFLAYGASILISSSRLLSFLKAIGLFVH